MCVLSALSRVWLFEIPWTVACQAPLSMEFSRQENWNGLPFPTPGSLPNLGIEPTSLTLTGRFFTTSTSWEDEIFYKFRLLPSTSLNIYPFSPCNTSVTPVLARGRGLHDCLWEGSGENKRWKGEIPHHPSVHCSPGCCRFVCECESQAVIGYQFRLCSLATLFPWWISLRALSKHINWGWGEAEWWYRVPGDLQSATTPLL